MQGTRGQIRTGGDAAGLLQASPPTQPPLALYSGVVTVGADGTAQMRKLKVGLIENGEAMIEEGLAVGEQIVTSGQYRVQPGAPLQVLTAEGQSIKFD